MKKPAIRLIAMASLIAALYVLLTLVLVPFSFGAVQVRLSEVLTVLACFTPAAVPGLAVGCLISNMVSPLPLDMLFGSVATLTAAFLAYRARHLTLRGLPLLSLYAPVPVNGLVVGAELCLYNAGTFRLSYWLLMALWVAAGEVIVCTVATLLYPVIRRFFNGRT